MSAWSEAVWIVKQMEKQLQANGEIQKYQQLLNDLTLNLNQLNNDFNKAIADIKTLEKIATPVLSLNNNGSPSQMDGNPQNGMIWFVIEEDNNG